jgi:hypothetical protein
MAGRALAIRCWLGRFRGLCRLRQLAIGLKERERRYSTVRLSKEWMGYELNNLLLFS